MVTRSNGITADSLLIQVVSKFLPFHIGQWITGLPDHKRDTWKHFSDSLTDRYGGDIEEVTNTLKRKLSKLRQSKRPMRDFATDFEHLLHLLPEPLSVSQSVSLFINGIFRSDMRIYLGGQTWRSLDDCILRAIKIEDLEKSREENNDNWQTTRKDYGNFPKDEKISKFVTVKKEFVANSKNRYKFTENGNPICAKCGTAGHKAIECRLSTFQNGKYSTVRATFNSNFNKPRTNYIHNYYNPYKTKY